MRWMAGIGMLASAAESAAQEMPDGSILHLDGAMLVEMGVYAFNIILLVVAISLLLYKPVKRFMSARTERIRAKVEQAEREEEEARLLREKYEGLIENIERERDEILRKGRAASLERGEEIISEARREAANIYRRSMEELRMEQENALDDMRRAIIEVSTQMASRFVAVSIDQETQEKYVDEALEHLEEALWES